MGALGGTGSCLMKGRMNCKIMNEAEMKCVRIMSSHHRKSGIEPKLVK